MGIDAAMFAGVSEPLTSARLNILTAELGACDWLWVHVAQSADPTDHDEWPTFRRVGRPFTLSEEPLEPEPVEWWEIATLSRFYSADYRRGNPYRLVSLARWIEDRMGAICVYGSDTYTDGSGVVFDAAERNRMLDTVDDPHRWTARGD